MRTTSAVLVTDLVDPSQTPSINVIESALVRAEESYRFRAGSVDSKAGLLLGAVGVLIALVGSEPSVPGLLAQFFAALSGIMLVLSLRPRRGEGMNPRKLRDQYLQADPPTARINVLNAGLSAWEKDEARLKTKDTQFTAAAVLLLVAAASIVVGAAVSVSAG